MNATIAIRTFLLVLAGAMKGCGLLMFGVGLKGSDSPPPSLPLFGLGIGLMLGAVLVFSLREFKFSAYSLSAKDKKTTWKIAAWLYVPAICLAIIAIFGFILGSIFILPLMPASSPGLVNSIPRAEPKDPGLWAYLVVSCMMICAYAWFDYGALLHEVFPRHRYDPGDSEEPEKTTG